MSTNSIINYVFIGISLLGLIPSTLLILDKISESDSGVRKVCNNNVEGGEHCTAGFGKKATKFLGSIDWSDIGFAYFIFIIVMNLIGSDTFGVSVIILSSLFSIVYVLYLLYFQFYIAKSWCKFCLGVQGCLILMAIFSIFNIDKLSINVFSTTPYILLAFVIFIIILSSTVLFVSILEKNNNLSNEVYSFYRLKHLPQIINVLYQQNPKVENITDIGMFCNKESDPSHIDQISIIISPTCKECIQLLIELIPMIKRKKKTGINIIVVSDYRSVKPEQYDLALCLIEKYILKGGNYLDYLHQYAYNYPVSKEKLLRENTNKQEAEVLLNENIEWCKKNRMFNTPALFLNGKFLPNVYSTLDVDYFTE